MIDESKSTPKSTEEKTAEKVTEHTAELNSDVYRVLFDHEMERGGGTGKIPQPRRRRRILKE